MKIKNQACFLPIIILFCVCLFGCNSSLEYKFAQSYEHISKIELIKISEDNEEILAELTADSKIISDIQNLQCKKYWNDPNHSIMGLAIKIYYTDSSYEIITWESNVYYSGNSHNYGWEYFDKDSFNSILDAYLE